MEKEDPADVAMRGLVALFSDPRINSFAHFRCLAEGEESEFSKSFEAMMDKLSGRTRARQKWVRRLRRLGLIEPNRKARRK